MAIQYVDTSKSVLHRAIPDMCQPAYIVMMFAEEFYGVK